MIPATAGASFHHPRRAGEPFRLDRPITVAQGSGCFAWRRMGRVLMSMWTLATSLLAQNPDDGFAPSLTPGPRGIQVYSITTQSDGMILVGGLFPKVNNWPHINLVRLRADGSLDSSFNAGTDDSVAQTALQSDGKILIAGLFTTVSNQPRTQIARLNADGTLDQTFNPVVAGVIATVALQSDGKILIAGSFTKVAGVDRRRFARLNSNGTLDVGFNPDPDGTVYALVPLPDGKILVGGSFGQLAGQARARIGRLNADGSLDVDFDARSVSGPIHAIAVQSDGRAVVGGSFTQIQGQGRPNIARLERDGTLDLAFNPGANNNVNALALQPDGKIVLGGSFTTIGSATRKSVARVNADGSADLSFQVTNGAPNNSVFTVAVQPDGKILIGGDFTSVGGLPRPGLARLDADGAVEMTFGDLFLYGDVSALALQGNDNLLVAGRVKNFTGSYVVQRILQSGQGANRATHLQNSGAEAAAFAVAVKPDGQVIIGGAFTEVGGVTRNRLARFNAAGTLDASFTPEADALVYALALQPDGKILVGGDFTVLNTKSHHRLGRLNADGTLDDAFAPDIDGTVACIAWQPDGKILIGGLFTHVNSQVHNRLARLNADGSLDTGFNPDVNNNVYAIAIRPNGKIMIGGYFSRVNSNANHQGVAVLNVDGSLDGSAHLSSNGNVYSFAQFADGSFCIGGTFTAVDTLAGRNACNRIARLNADGVFDAAYRPVANGDVEALAVQSDGKIVVGGFFTQVNSLPRSRVARLSAHAAATRSLDVNTAGTQITWTLGGSSPVPAWVRFESSTDNVTWTDLGLATFSTGSWRLTAPAGLPLGNVFVRARGVVPTGILSSSSLLESVRLAYVARSSRLLNLSTRAQCLIGDNVLIPGFVVSGTANKRLLIRAVGPTLGKPPFNLGGVLADPRMRLLRRNTTTQLFEEIAANDNWGANSNAADITTTAASLFAFGFNDDREAALLMDLPPGEYTVNAGGVNNVTGLAIVELYDADSASVDSQLINISNRGFCGVGDQVMIPGFVVSSEGPKTLLVRVVGPTLSGFGVNGTMVDPKLTVFSGKTPILENDNWSDPATSGNAATTAQIAAQVFAFPLAAGSKDAAFVVTLQPGSYTVVGSSATSGGTGVVLVEVYVVP